MVLPEAANRRWPLDFVSDTLANGRRFQVLAVVDDFTRECLGLVADTSLSGLRVCRELDRIVDGRGCRPTMIVSDNGTELTSHAILRWQEERGILWHYIAPGNRDTPDHEAWRIDYNTERPHTSLDGLTPTAFETRPSQGHMKNGLCL